MKAYLPVALLVLAAGAFFAFDILEQNRLREQQLADYERHVQELLNRVEDTSRERLDYEKTIDRLESEITELSSRLTAVSNELNLAQQQIDPDYELLESEIRQQVRYEYEQQRQLEESLDPRTSLIKQLSSLDPLELGEIMSVNGQFSAFLQALEVDDARMEVIVGVLSDLVAEQNQARQRLMLQAQTDDIGRRELRGQLMEIMSPAAQREALSFALSDEELTLWDQVQSQQTNGRGRFRAMTLSNDAVGGVPFYTGPLREQRGNGSAIAVPVEPTIPRH